MKNIIFDIGNVLADFQWKQYLNSLFSDEKTREVLTKAYWDYELWREMDRGAMPQSTIKRELLRIAAAEGYEKEMQLSYERIGECIWQFSYAKDWIRELKAAGYKVYYLSNYSRYLIAENPRALDFTELMDGGIYSCDVQLLKPDLAIYDMLCRRYELDPKECLFLDDKLINVIAARECGLHSLVVTNYEEMKPAVDAYLKEH